MQARTWLISALLIVGGAAAQAGKLAEPIPAPEWSVSEWINGDPGNLADQRGKVVLIEFFQLWCPGCKRFSIPLFNRWHERYGKRKDVVVLSIHTVFEGHSFQSPARLREFVGSQGMRHPVGIDTYAGPGDETPVTMRRYRTRGTPQVVIIDPEGRLRFSHFGSFDEQWAEGFIERLLAGSADKPRERPPAADVSW